MSYLPPNYTQIPNALLDEHMPTMGEAELKVTLAISRKTLGWHKAKDRISLTQLMEATGMSRQGVINGLESALLKGIVGRTRKGQSFEYSLLVNEVDQSTTLTGTSQRSRPELVNEVDTQKKGNKTKETIIAPTEPDQPKLKDHPAVKAYREVFALSMKRGQYRFVQHIDDLDKWTSTLESWSLRGYSPTNLQGMLDWYNKGVPAAYKRKQAKAQEWDTSRQDHPGWTKDWSHVQVKEDYDHESINF